jgi:hypothetical protein
MAPLNPELHIPAKDWEKTSEISNALKPVKIATKCLQQQQLTFGK